MKLKAISTDQLPEWARAAARPAVRSASRFALADRLVLMVRDAETLQIYWRLSPKRLEKLRRQTADHCGVGVGRVGLALRLHRLEGESDAPELPEAGRCNQYPCQEWAPCWYLPLPRPCERLVCEVGLTVGDRFWSPLVRSNVVRVPPPVEVEDVQFATIALDDALPAAWRGGSAPVTQLINEAGQRVTLLSAALSTTGQVGSPGSPGPLTEPDP